MGQDWVDVQVDQWVSVRLPDGYESIDTMGAHTWRSMTNFGTILVLRIPNPPEANEGLQMETERDLENFYLGVEKGFSENGQVIVERELIDMKGLLALRIVVAIDLGDSTIEFENRSLYLDDLHYSFQYIPHLHTSNEEGLSLQRASFFDGIGISSGTKREDQYQRSAENSLAYRMGKLVGSLIIPVILVVVIISFVLRWQKQKFKRLEA